MIYFTADWHRGQPTDKFKEVYTPFKTPKELDAELLRNAKKLTSNDILIFVGDVVDCREGTELDSYRKKLFSLPQHLRCRCDLVIGNNEYRYMNNCFGGRFDAFAEYLNSLGWYRVNTTRKFQSKILGELHITHRPDMCPKQSIGIVGHFHMTGPILPDMYNVSCYCNYFSPVSLNVVEHAIVTAKELWKASQYAPILGKDAWK